MQTPIPSLVIVILLALAGTNCARKTSQTGSAPSSTNSPAATGTSSDNSQPSSTATTSGNTASSPSTKEYAAYAGRYKMESDEVGYLNVVLEDNKLYGYPDNQPKTEIKYESKDRFNFETPRGSGTVTFTRDSQQQITGMIVMVNGNALKGEKVKQ